MLNEERINEYLENTIDIIRDYNIIPYEKVFKDDFGIVGQESYYLGPQLDPSFFRINGDESQTFGYGDYIKKLQDYYHNNEIENDRNLEESLKNTNKKTIVTMGFHPRKWNLSKLRTHFFDELFKDTLLLNSLKDGRAHLYLYYAWEADNFYWEQPDGLSYDSIFYDVIKDYNLPYNSLIIHSSNSLGYQQHHSKYSPQSLECPQYIYETAYEPNTFKSLKGPIDINYTVDDYIENCKKADKTLLRVNRTHLKPRDVMLMYLYKSNQLSKCLIEHNKFAPNIDEFNGYLTGVINHAYELGYDNLLKYFRINHIDIENLKKMTPFVASDIEKNNSIGMNDIYSNETIPYDIYKKTIFSWVSTSLVEEEDQVFINSSTFNPILYYHPIVYHSNGETSYFLQKSGYLSYNWLYDEQRQDFYHDNRGRLSISINEIDKLLNLSKDDLIDKIIENKHILKYNREKLFCVDSVRRIINRLHSILYEHR